MPGWSQDARFAWRMINKERWTTLVIVVIMALGIGANATVFTLVNAVLFKAIPIPEGDRFYAITGQDRTRNEGRQQLSWPEIQDLRAAAKSLEGVAAISMAPVNVTDEDHAPERYAGGYATPNLFQILRVAPIVGRDMTAADGNPGAQRVVLLSYGMWKTRYAASASVIGKPIRIDGQPATIVGVMPDGFHFPSRAQLWTSFIPEARDEKRDRRGLSAFTRLAPGATPAQARAELDIFARKLQADHPATNKNVELRLMTMHDLMNGGEIRIVFLALLGAVAFVLMIACANVANLQISRAVARTREMSVRVALGASRWRVIRQLLVENIVLAIVAAALGFGIAIFGVRAFDAATVDTGRPYWIQFTFEPVVFAYVAVVCLLTGVLSGLAPALQLAKVDVNEALKEAGRGTAGSRRRWLAQTLVVGELALATVLLAGAGLMIRSFFEAYQIGNELNPRQLLSARVSLTDDKYEKREARENFYAALREKLNGVAGVRAAAIVSHAPYGGAMGWRYEMEGKPVDKDRIPTLEGIRITPEYFRVMNLTLLRGREFDETDGSEGKQTAIVNKAFAARHWPNDDPIGKRFRLLRDDKPQPWITVIGVSPDIHQANARQREVDPVIYLPMREDPQRWFTVLVSSTLAPSALAAPVRAAVAAVDPYLPTSTLETLAESLAGIRWPYRVFGTLFTVFALIALGLAAVGIFGVMAYAVGQRTAEIGLRMALGATEKSILAMVMRTGLWQIVIGLALGLAAALAAARFIMSVLTRVSPTDPVTFVSVFVILGAAGLIACWLPARRALRVDPLTALRHE